MSKEKTVCIDFDGVISKYDNWKGKGNFGDPITGAIEFINRLKIEGWTIIIHTTRSETDSITDYLIRNNICFDFINYNPENVKLGLNLGKPIAEVYLDDRGLKFNGNWEETYNQIKNFKVWYRKER